MATNYSSNDTPNYIRGEQGQGQNALKDFQFTPNIKDKSTKAFGLKVAQNINAEINSAYFTSRNARFYQNRKIANGRHNEADFRKRLNMEGSENYVEISFKAIMIISTIISRLVGRWMQNGEKIIVSAVDPLSKKEKKDEYDDAEFLMNNADMAAQLQDATGLPMAKQGQFIPQSQDELDMWAEEEQKLAQEIKYEKAENSILSASGWFDVIKDKVLTDSAEVGLIAAEVMTQKDGMVKVEYKTPENVYYSKSIYPDFRDRTWEAEKIHLKIIDIREEYPEVAKDEKVMFKIAQRSSQYSSQLYPNFIDSWYTDDERPYDDWGVDVLKYRIKTSDSDIVQMSVTGNGKLIMSKNEEIDFKKKQKNATYLKDDTYNIYQGVYVLGTDILLEWGIMDNLVRPQDAKESGDCEFPMSLFMYKQYQMRNLAVPEKIEEPVEQMILTRLKIQQIVASLRPAGIMVDITSSRELELAPGEKYGALKLQKIYDQTGNWYFEGITEEGTPGNAQPVRELPNVGGLTQLQGLITTYNYHYQVLREQVGINENAEGQTPKARVTNSNFQSSVEFSYNATDYMYDAYLRLMEQVAKKVGCLLHKSVSFGGKYYKDVLSEKDVEDRVFDSEPKMLPTDEEIQYLDTLLTNALNTNPTFILYCNPILLRNMVKENYKQAWKYFRDCQQKAIEGEMQKSQQLQEQNSQTQIQAAQAATQGQAQLQQMKDQSDATRIREEGREAQKTAMITMFTQLATKGVAMPPELQPLWIATIQNILVPISTENQEQQQQIIQRMQQQQQNTEQAPAEIPQSNFNQ